MLKRLYQAKKFEEVLGLIGIVYFILLALVIFFFVGFLTNATKEAFVPAAPRESAIVQFAIPQANALVSSLHE